MNKETVFNIYIHTIDDIQDFLKYRYVDFNRYEIRNIILEKLDKMSEDMVDLMVKQTNKQNLIRNTTVNLNKQIRIF